MDICDARRSYMLLPWTFLLISNICFLLQGATDANKKDVKEETKLSKTNVYDRGLVRPDVKVKDIVKYHASYCADEAEQKRFTGETLAYITPWNNHGYDVAKIFGNKLTYVSPVWLQLQFKGSTYVMQGGHDIDRGWIEDVTRNRNVKIVPRVLFDGWSVNDYQVLFSSESNQADCISSVLNFITYHKFHGIALEVWAPHRKQELYHFLNHFADTFHEKNKKLILVLPPPVRNGQPSGMIDPTDFKTLATYIDAFSLMTYDYSTAASPGPNSPIQWMRECVEMLVPDSSSPNRKKILLGLNFYGNDYVAGQGSALLGKQVTNREGFQSWIPTIYLTLKIPGLRVRIPGLSIY